MSLVRKGGKRHFSACALLLVLATSLPAGDVTLKNGMKFEGTAAPVQGLSMKAARQNSAGDIIAYPAILIDDGMRRIFVPRRQVAEQNNAAELSRYETFTLKQIRTSRKEMLGSLEGYVETTPFNEFGQRTHVVNTQFGQKSLVVGIEKLSPKILSLVGINYDWEHAISTTSVPADVLGNIVRKTIDLKNPDDRMAIARFYLQAGMYPHCDTELDSIAADFPERKENVAELRQQLRQLKAQLILSELRNRRSAGQHLLAYQSLQQFPTEGMSAAVLREVRELKSDYDGSRIKAEKATKLIGELHAQLDDRTLAESLAAHSKTLQAELNYDTLSRLEPFLNLESDSSLSAEEKLGLAYSGWVLGGAGAITDLNAAVGLWKARQLITDYLHSESSPERAEILTQLQGTEGVGIERVMQIVPNLPPAIETPNVLPMQPAKIEVADGLSETPPVYEVLLPEEYNPLHRYPLIVALNPAERLPEAELVWWGGNAGDPGQASRRGYIVIAPHYLAQKTRAYDYSTAAHDVVLRSMTDARKRFRIDSDRVYLSGHGAGGDAAFDIGMTHPDLFAGVIPITGVCTNYCRWHYPNAKQTAFYIVGGELDLDRNSIQRDTMVVDRMMVAGQDVTYVEYIGRGYESYYEEIHRLFDWMELHRRQKYPKEFELKVLRTNQDRCQWVRVEGFPPNVTGATVLAGKSRGTVTPMNLTAKVAPGKNAVRVTSGVKKYSLWFSPELVSFEERLVIESPGKKRFNDFLKPSIATVLEDLRIRGDREMLFTARIDIE